MLELIQQWGEALQKGGPWFLVALLGGIVFFGGRWLLGRSEKLEAELRKQIEELQKAAIEREKTCATEMAKALKDQDDICEKKYEALREESRSEHNQRNDEIREVVVSMTNALNQEAAAKHLQAKALDELKESLQQLTSELRRGK